MSLVLVAAVRPRHMCTRLLPKLYSAHASMILHMLQLQLLIFLTLGMEVDTADSAIALVEADVVEALEAGACYRFDSMVWHQEILLPPHEQVLSLEEVLQCEVG